MFDRGQPLVGPEVTALVLGMVWGGPFFQGRGGAEGGKRGEYTCQPCVEAQTLVPSELKMAALSTSPVPTRLHTKGRVSHLSLWLGLWPNPIKGKYASVPLVNVG